VDLLTSTVRMLKNPIIAFLLLLALASAGRVADRRLARADRLRWLVEREHLWEVRDAILRFHLDRERFPNGFDELVDSYLPKSLTLCRPAHAHAPQTPLLWDPGTGVLSWPGPFPIRGLVRHDQPLRLNVTAPQIHRDPITGEALRDATDQAVQPDLLDVVVEAEHFQFLTYGWEIGHAADAAGGAFIHLKEGRGDLDKAGLELHADRRAGDVYNITRDNRLIETRCWFDAPQSGTYNVWVRTMAHRSNCSNIINIFFNSGVRRAVGHNGSTPYSWLWHQAQSVQLKQGLNTLGFGVAQDDVKVDQVLLTRATVARPPGTRFYVGDEPLASIATAKPPLAVLSLSSDTLAIGSTNDPSVEIYVLNNRLDLQKASLELTLDLPGDRTRRRLLPLTATDHRLLRFPYAPELPRPLEKREYLLRCRLLHNDVCVQSRTLVLFHNYDWRILGPLPFIEAATEVAPESTRRPTNPCTIGGNAYRWSRYDERNTDHFGVMDLGKMFSGRTYSAMPNATAYAYTEVFAEAAGEYLLKGMGDDDLVVWINAERVLAITKDGTVIRTALDRPVTLLEGRNHVLYRINQRQGQWQAGVRIRTLMDRPAMVLGIPYAEQTVSTWDDSPPENPVDIP